MGGSSVRTTTSTELVVERLQPDAHAELVDGWGATNLQVPEWAKVKAEWRNESLVWRRPDGTPAGCALVLYRPIPHVGRYLAYLPEGPLLPWDEVVADPEAWLAPLIAHLRTRRAFAVRLGPTVPLQHWSTATAKAGLADEALKQLDELPADQEDPTGQALVEVLRGSGWQSLSGGHGFAAGQPDYVVQVPLAGRSEADLRAAMNQEWRRNLNKGVKLGVEVREGTRDDLPAFHTLYRETATRDKFTPRPEAYFRRMWDAFAGGTEVPGTGRTRMRLYLAELDGQPLAGALVVRVGTHATYTYGASTSAHREARASNALQWRAMRDALAEGCHVYDFRGISSTLDADSPLIGLLRFKLGAGGEVTRYVGEWELTLSQVWHTALRAYLRLRS